LFTPILNFMITFWRCDEVWLVVVVMMKDDSQREM